MKTDVVPLHYLMKRSHLVEDNIQNQDLQNIEINHKEKNNLRVQWSFMDEFVKKLYDFRGIYRIFFESK